MIAARCEIDLSAGGREPAAQPDRRVEAGVHGAGHRKAELGDQRLRARAAASPAIHSATTPSLMSAAGYRAMSVMLTPARPSASASSAITPGRLGTEARSSNSAPPASCASSSRRRSAAAASFQAVIAVGVAGAQRLAERRQARRSRRRARRSARRALDR